MADYLHNKCCVFRPRFGEIYKIGVPGGESSEETLTYILQDETGAEYPAVLVDEKVVFTATANDIRQGKVAATSEGVTEGTKVIPSYHITASVKIVPAGSKFEIYLPNLDTYDFTELQCLICPFNCTITNSVSTEKVVIGNDLYNVQSTLSISTVIRDSENKSIDFGITNETEVPYLIRFFTYKEIK